MSVQPASRQTGFAGQRGRAYAMAPNAAQQVMLSGRLSRIVNRHASKAPESTP